MVRLIDSHSYTIEATGSDTSGQPSSNLTNQQPTVVWRATDLNNAYVECDLGSSTTVNAVCLLYHNMTQAGMVRVRAASTQANLTADPAYDEKVLARSNQESVTLVWTDPEDDPDYLDYDRWYFIHLISTDQKYRWWRIDCLDDSNPDGYIQAGRLLIDRQFQPNQGIRYGWSIRYNDGSERQQSRDGQIFPRSRSIVRMMDVNVRWNNESDMWNDLARFQRIKGTSSAVLLIPDASNTARLRDWSIYGTFTQMRPLVNFTFNHYETRFSITELI